ncbi:hypothetical protein DFH27DRAFT_615261 [Peziza echinospora]|nr:hypothetical protein DFH27DRAFT_615261 [Peziza echinospora]
MNRDRRARQASSIWQQSSGHNCFWLDLDAGAGAYYFAKQEINASRREKYIQLQKRKQHDAEMEYEAKNNGYNGSGSYTQHTQHSDSPAHELAGSPSDEASTEDPAPTRHAPLTENQRVAEKSKYEAAKPYRAPKGDRFS